MQVTLIGIDLAKNIFQVCGVNQAGKPLFNKAIKRQHLQEFINNYPHAVIAMEACSGSNYWGREFKQRGRFVQLIPPQHVKPFVKGNKNDRNDAFAITEAARRPNLHCVEPRSLAQTDMIQVHRLRERIVAQRTALINQLRGFLNEYGIVVSQGKEKLLATLPHLLEDASNGLTVSARRLFRELLSEWQHLNASIRHWDKEIAHQAATHESAIRLQTLKGVGEKIATAVIAHAGNGSGYKNGRHFSANLGLTPKEHSSGGKQKLAGISKRGNSYLRQMLIQGAWSVLRYADRSDDSLSRFAQQVKARRGAQKAVVAVANKMARIIWSMLSHQTEYQNEYQKV